jgi:hypothetical protein
MILAQTFKTARGAADQAAHRQGCADDAFKRGDAAFRYAFRIVRFNHDRRDEGLAITQNAAYTWRIEKTRVK